MILQLCDEATQESKATLSRYVMDYPGGKLGELCLQGMHIAADGPQLVSAMIRGSLGLDCSVLMGANIAEVCSMIQDRLWHVE